MTDADTQELVKAMVQRLDAHDVAGLMELMSPDVEFIQPASMGATRGREAVAQRIGPLSFEGFSQDRTESRSVASCGDSVTLEPVVTTTHRTLRTPAGDLPPTGKTISIPYCNVLKIEAGRISSAHIYVDQLGFMAQLGLLHVFEFRDGLIFRENVWLDAASAIAQLTES